MNFLATLLVLMIAAQPAQAGFCDMEPSGNVSAHAGMQHDQDPGSTAHDCCSPADFDEDQGCTDMVPCGFCGSGVLAVAFVAHFDTPLLWADQNALGHGCILPSHTSVPFRPPISIS
jgi:hypothetical protein